MVDVFPVVAPGKTDTAAPVIVKLALTPFVTVIEAMPVATLYSNELLESGM